MLIWRTSLVSQSKIPMNRNLLGLFLSPMLPSCHGGKEVKLVPALLYKMCGFIRICQIFLLSYLIWVSYPKHRVVDGYKSSNVILLCNSYHSLHTILWYLYVKVKYQHKHDFRYQKDQSIYKISPNHQYNIPITNI